MQRHFLPPLRLILNNNCNGKCCFCHKEGNDREERMSKEIVYRCAEAANELMIPNITLTGGEPTLREDLSELLNGIQERSINTKVGLTTNGFRLMEIGSEMKKPIDFLNLSIISFDKEVAAEYQNVDPEVALKALERFPAERKNLNVVVVKENYKKLHNFIDYCIEKSISLDLMFESKNDFEYQEIQKMVLHELTELKEADILLHSTPTLNILLAENCKLRVKHPFLSRLLCKEICKECEQKISCFEHICAVRVHPSGMVTPCLSQKISERSNDVYSNIKNVYAMLEDTSSMYDFML